MLFLTRMKGLFSKTVIKCRGSLDAFWWHYGLVFLSTLCTNYMNACMCFDFEVETTAEEEGRRRGTLHTFISLLLY